MPIAGNVEVTLTGEKTSTGGPVFSVGVPRFQLMDAEGVGRLILRERKGFAFAEDGEFVSIWDSETGRSVRRIAPRLESWPRVFVSMAVSADGQWLASGSSGRVRLFRAPFERVEGELACRKAFAFSHTGQLLACATNTLGIWDVAKRKLVAALEPNVSKGLVRAVAFSPDDKSLVWATEYGVQRWDFAAAAATTTIFRPSERIEYATIAERATIAYITLTGNKALLIDLSTGKTHPVPAQYGAELSPSGQRLVLTKAEVTVLELSSGKELWSAKTTSPVTRFAFGEADDALSYVDGGHLRVVKLPSRPRTTPEPARFAGWLGDGVAAIETGGQLRSFALASSTWDPADRSTLTPRAVSGAPPWAKWVSAAGTAGMVAAAPSARNELEPARRGLEPCNPKQRVWTPTGGEKTLTMNCTKAELEGHEDPGWAIGGGWAVGVSSKTTAVYNARTGKRVATIEVPPGRTTKPELAPSYWHMALSPEGDWLALVWRRPVLIGSTGTQPPDPREDAMHLDDSAQLADCEEGESGCQLEYFLELWNLKGTPARVSQARLERSIPSRPLPAPASPTGVLVFDRTGETLLIGLDHGELRVVPTGKPNAMRSEYLHAAPIRDASIDPSGHWVYSADSAGEQKLWKLVP